MFKKLLTIFILAFSLGWVLNSVSADFALPNKQMPFPFNVFSGDSISTLSPADHIKENQIHVYDKMVVLDIKNASWASFTPTHSMDPLLDSDSNGIEIKPASTEDIHVGDVVSYKSEFVDGLVIHRIVQIGYDIDGWFARIKGDNNPSIDPGKIRFSQINGILVAVIY